jgi:predicted transcriptional regulator of viral defense system
LLANRNPKSLPSLILSHRLYLSGETFSPRDLYSTLKVPANQVTAALATLADRGEVERIDEGVYRRPQIHWIHKRKLA